MKENILLQVLLNTIKKYDFSKKVKISGDSERNISTIQKNGPWFF